MVGCRLIRRELASNVVSVSQNITCQAEHHIHTIGMIVESVMYQMLSVDSVSAKLHNATAVRKQLQVRQCTCNGRDDEDNMTMKRCENNDDVCWSNGKV